jgi:hypothetical protein
LRQPCRITKPARSYAAPASMMKWRKSGNRTAPSCCCVPTA